MTYEIECPNGHTAIRHCHSSQRADPCPDCGGAVTLVWRGSAPFMVKDGIPGGLIVHNLGPTPVKVYSHAERRAIMRAVGRKEMVYHVDGDKHVGRMV